jgi:hypothetical protein
MPSYKMNLNISLPEGEEITNAVTDLESALEDLVDDKTLTSYRLTNVEPSEE